MNIFQHLENQSNDPLYDWKQSMNRSRSITCLNRKVDITTSLIIAGSIIDKILQQSNPKEVKEWTWLDPAAGRGTFGYLIFIILFDYLKDEIPNIEERKKHILSKIYLAEINEGLCNNLKRNFTNVFNVDSLEYNFNMKFDVVIGNPPYQSNTLKSATEAAGKNSLWVKFIKIFDHLVKKDGYCGMIVSSSWLNGSLNQKIKGRFTSNQVRSFLKQRDILFMGIDYINKFFDVSTDIMMFLYKKSFNNIKTEVFDGKKSILINNSECDWIPSELNDITFSILKKVFWGDHEKLVEINTKGPGSDVRHKEYSNTQSEIFKYPLYSSSSKHKNNQNPWCSVPGYLSNIKKVIYSRSGYACPIYDDGYYGLGPGGRAFKVPSRTEGENLVNFLNSSLIKFGGKTKRSSGTVSYIALLKESIPKVDLTRSWTDQELYEYFNLTQEEIDYIEENT